MTPGMQCPSCKVDLVMTERQNIEIDYCPQCRGVWLDRGELDKIIERSAAPQVQPGAPPAQPFGQPPSFGHKEYRYKKPKHWLKDIFD